ncbi:MAG: hypothetical protein R2726_19075 [Acidimicrobiales bacterium]
MTSEADDADTPRRSRRLRSTLVLVAIALGIGVYEVGWGDDPVFGWYIGLFAIGLLLVQLVWLPRGLLLLKAVLTLFIVAGGLVLATDPFLAVARARVATHRADMDAIGTQTLTSPTTGVFSGTRAPVGPVVRLAGTEAVAPVPDVPRIAGESVTYGAVVLEPAPRALYCLDQDCNVVVVYSPAGTPPPATTCPDGRTDQVDALLDDWYRMLRVTC